MPEPVAQLEHTQPAFLAPELVVVIEVRNVGKFLTQAQPRFAAIDRNRSLERTEPAREIEMLVRRQMLIRKDQDRVFRERFLDGEEIGGFDRLRRVDIANLGDKARGDRADVGSHDAILRAKARLISEDINRAGPTCNYREPTLPSVTTIACFIF